MRLKYQLTDETKTLLNGTVLYRIQALRDGPWGPAGTLGGWVQFEENLSHYGNCWVYDEAKVFGNATVYENACVSENAKIFGNAEVSENALLFGNAKVYENAWVYGDAWVSGNQKVNGYCFLDGDEKGQEFQVNNICICDYDYCNLKKYRGCCWEISQVYEGWVQAKHGDEEIAFRNEWLRKL